jgi:hypothetical protein
VAFVEMKNNILIPIVIVAVFLTVVFVLFTGGGGREPSDPDAFAQCLTDKGAKMYGASWCSHCNNQKESFGDSWEHIDYVECSSPLGGMLAECGEAGIRGYPTWVFPGDEKVPGELSFEDLSAYSGCPMD